MADPERPPASRAVFLSYTTEDVAIALAVCEALREAGIEVWMDRSELQGGDTWDANIHRQIRECTLFIPIISKRTQARREGYFRLEWRLADERMRLVAEGTPLIVPVVADETREQDALVPKSFLTVQWSRLPHGHVPPAFVGRVRKLLGLETSAAAKTVPPFGVPPAPSADPLVAPGGSPRPEPVVAWSQPADPAAMELMAPDEPTNVRGMSAAGGGSASSRRSFWSFAPTAIFALLVGVGHLVPKAVANCRAEERLETTRSFRPRYTGERFVPEHRANGGRALSRRALVCLQHRFRPLHPEDG